ncbi:ubiquitin carboxyl-terminal hydrolase 8 [Malaya genurostris]|uniref:ubiquitin carboxyl-terminal hydrolase 8 n=1 Tax=Malaya genurostris TaxID=325434 RepID=UPI0026F3E22B|nr:ubiquitin carboxyl-terminal hydrolase 8 [Malaya genurostris]XP_058447197.1 ubiquitin carboxyl-terminal hydrolase 8 [Malaya genurostris]
MGDLKPLHLGSNLQDLESHYQLNKTITNKKLQILCNGAKKLKQQADRFYLERDEENAYVNYMKFFNLIETIRKNKEYAEKKPMVLAILGSNSEVTLTLNKLEKLATSLKNRYAGINASREREMNKSRSQKDNISTIMPYAKSAVDAKELFGMINDSKLSMLIMDCRSDEDFEKSRLKYDHVINIPDSWLVAGMTAGKIHEKLGDSSKPIWQSRRVKEQIVLMDYNTTGTPTKDSPIWVLNVILKNWDPDTNYTKPLLRVEGGYKEFQLLYPMCCINPNYSPPGNEISYDTRLEDIEYPNISDIRMKEDSFSSQPDRPIIDRNSKAAALHTYEAKAKPINEILDEQEKLMDKSAKNEKELFSTVVKLEQVHDVEEKTVDDEEKRQLREKATQLHYMLMQMENKQKDYISENTILREQVQELEAKERSFQEQGERISAQQARKLEEAANRKRLKDDETIREQERVRLTHEREEKLKIAYENKRHMKDYQDDVGIPQPKIPQIDRSAKPTHIVSDYKGNVQRDFSPVIGSVGRGLTGLKNLGNTCYMNSILQCLSNTRFLTEYFVEGTFRNNLNRSNKTGGRIAEEVAAVVYTLWTGKYKCIASKNLRYVVGQYERQFSGVEQQDSHEFLTILMDWLHSDLQTVAMQIDSNLDDLQASEKAWLEYLKYKESYVSQLFYGQIKSTVKCKRCGKESATYESFSSLSLELPYDSNRCHLNDCLEMYFHGEHIRGWNCPRCKSNQDAVKKLDISRLPSILVIHFKRFYADADPISTMYRKKQSYVKFPLVELDMSTHIAPSELNRNKHLRNRRYHLYGVSNHYGSMESGHYTAFCKNWLHQKWYKFDDHTVANLDMSDICSSAAYILFYSMLPDQSPTDMQIR